MNEVNPGLVSIIIPTYKRKNVIKAVDSALSQDYEKKEIIVVDDNADNPEYRESVYNELSEYIEDQKITLILNTKRLGGGLSRNKGITASHGEYIAFLDDDDRWLPEKITKQVYRIEEADADIVYCWFCGENRFGDIVWENKKSAEGKLLIEAMTECIANTSLILVKRGILFKVGLFEDMPCKQDVYLELKLAIAGASFSCVKETLAVYGNADSDFQRLSNISYKTVLGMREVRDLARTVYGRLTKSQIAYVEADTAYKICIIAKTIGNRKVFKEELKIFWKFSHNLKKKAKLLVYWISLGK